MSPLQIKMVRETWGFVIAKSDKAGELFYSRLFEVAPGVRPLFKEDITLQARKLMNTVTYIVTKLDKIDTIIGEVKSLAQRHKKYGALKEHYPVVGDCLIYTLKTGLGDRWNPQIEAAWIAVYKALSTAMIEAQEEVPRRFA
ncbi:MAG TPA: globin family protein [Chryseosolibacter sp.]